MTSSVFRSVGLLGLVLILSAGSLGGAADEDTIKVWGEKGTEAGDDSPAQPSGGDIPPVPVTLAAFVPACDGNTYRTQPQVDVLCDIELLNCGPAANLGRRFYRFETTVMSNEAEPPSGPVWKFVAVVCRTPAQQAAAPVPVTVSLADFRRLPLPPAKPVIEPDRGELLIRMRTNTYVDPTSTTPTLIDLTLLGTPVQVRATPTTYTWDYGDTTTPVETSDPGAPYPDLTTWHVYETPGTYTVTLTTTYTGEYSVAGGPFQPIPGTATVESAPDALTLVARNNRLVG